MSSSATFRAPASSASRAGTGPRTTTSTGCWPACEHHLGRSSGRLHRAYNGPDYDGGWRGRLPQALASPARRSRYVHGATLLRKPRRRGAGRLAGDWVLFAAEVSPSADVSLDAEHD